MTRAKHYFTALRKTKEKEYQKGTSQLNNCDLGKRNKHPWKMLIRKKNVSWFSVHSLTYSNLETFM